MFIQSPSSSIDFQNKRAYLCAGFAVWFCSMCLLLFPLFSCSAMNVLKIGDAPQDVIAADFTTDGVDDLAIINTQLFGMVQLQFFLNDGNGNFPAAPNQLITVDSATPSFMTKGDFNGNGSLDIAVGLQGKGKVLIYFNNGNGSFNPIPTTIFTPAPFDLTVGDFGGGNGKRDLAVLSSKQGTVSIFLANADGTFRTGPVIQVADQLTTATSIVAGDLNQNNSDDFVVSLGTSNQLVVYLNNQGTFINSGTYTVERFPSQVVLGHLNNANNNANILDIAVANTMDNSISVLLNNGDGTFQTTATRFSTGNFAPLSLTIGDFNGDGNADIAVANEASSSVSLLLNNGNGTFQNPVIQETGSAPLAIASGTFIKNASPSFVVASFAGGTVNPALTAATSTSLTQSSSSSSSGEPVTFTATVTSSAATPTGNVNFAIDGGAPKAVSLVNGIAIFTTSAIPPGSHTITATYAGNITFGPSVASVTHSVSSGLSTSTVTITSSSNPSLAGDLVTLTAIVSGPLDSPVPTGSVTFFIDNQLIEIVGLVNGKASISRSFTEGSHTITANYGGNSIYSPSSNTFTQTVIRRIFPFVFPPINVEGFQKIHHSHGKKRAVNILTWEAPVGGNQPIAYEIFSDKELTKRIGSVPGDKFSFKIHPCRKKRVYTYFIVSVDAFGQRSESVKVKVHSLKKS